MEGMGVEGCEINLNLHKVRPLSEVVVPAPLDQLHELWALSSKNLRDRGAPLVGEVPHHRRALAFDALSQVRAVALQDVEQNHCEPTRRSVECNGSHAPRKYNETILTLAVSQCIAHEPNPSGLAQDYARHISLNSSRLYALPKRDQAVAALSFARSSPICFEALW